MPAARDAAGEQRLPAALHRLPHGQRHPLRVAVARNGVLLTPVTAEVTAELLATGKLPELAAPFTVDRFGR